MIFKRFGIFSKKNVSILDEFDLTMNISRRKESFGDIILTQETYFIYDDLLW